MAGSLVAAQPSTAWNFADVWQAVAAQRPDTLALVHGDRRISWAEFDSEATMLAVGLQARGLVAGDVVALCLRNRAEYLIALFACFKVSLVPAGCNFRHTASELVEQWTQVPPRAVVFDAVSRNAVLEAADTTPLMPALITVAEQDATMTVPRSEQWKDVLGSPELLRPAGRPRSGDDPLIIFTGGTTGRPKGVLWRQDDLFVLLNRTAQHPYDEDAGLDGLRSRLAEQRRAPRLVVGPPLVHGLGLLTAINALAAGGTVATLAGRSFSALEFLQTATDIDATQVVIAGDAFAQPVLELVRADPARWTLESLRVVLSSGTRWTARTRQELVDAFPKLRCVDVLGASEAIGVAASVAVSGALPATENSFELGRNAAVIDDDGNPLARGVAGQGRLATRGRSPVSYVGDAELSRLTFIEIDGQRWTVLGDIAYVDADGVITLVGRGTSVINTGGEKVFAEEVEDALRRAPGVVDAVVVGVEDDTLGETVVAIVQPREPATFDAAELMRALRGGLAGYKLPRRVLPVDLLPRDLAGKLDRPALRRYAAITCESAAITCESAGVPAMALDAP